VAGRVVKTPDGVNLDGDAIENDKIIDSHHDSPCRASQEQGKDGNKESAEKTRHLDVWVRPFWCSREVGFESDKRLG
jgi:hypothetical protein